MSAATSCAPGAGALRGKRIVLGVSGGIAAYKAAELTSRLVSQGAQVRAVMTEHATKFIQPLTLETLSANRVYVDAFEHSWEIEHISLAKWAELLVVAPATANILAKFACGIADDLLSTTAMAITAPMLVAPAMNTAMWRCAANMRNVATLKERGVHFIGPDSGRLACGDVDEGRMSQPMQIVEEIARILLPRRDFAGQRVLVTAGPTREMIDPVRFVSNRSSGKMGYALAEAAQARGAQVTLVSGPVALDTPPGVHRVDIHTTLELYEQVVALARESDIVLQAAAPADFRPTDVAARKIKKSEAALTIELTPNPDIALQLGRDKRPGQVLVAFAAETDQVLENARLKLERKNADLLVANDVSMPGAGFEGDTNRVTLITRQEEAQLPMMSKRAVADAILDRVRALSEA